MQKRIAKKDFRKFIEKLISSHEFIAPVKQQVTRFDKVKKFEEIYLDKITEVPPKDFLFPEGETLVKINNGKPEEVVSKIKKRILFGLRMCDLNAINILDKVMYDVQYLEHRKKTTLIGIFCENPDEYCFCNSMDLIDFYDLFIFPVGDYYHIAVGSIKGEKIVKELKDSPKELPLPKPKNTKILKKTDVKGNYNNPCWEKDANKCLSCSACTAYCPTCNCFDIKDILDVNLKGGERKRFGASCQLKNFSRVAGGKSYRDTRLARFKHFVYHKIVYFKDQKNMYMCVGCGRCLRVCPTHIDWVETINNLGSEKK